MMGVFGSARRRWARVVLASALCLMPCLDAVLGTGNVLRAPVRAGATPAYAAEGDGFLWSVGGIGQDEARHIAVDAAGAIYLTGLYSSTVDLDSGPEEVALTSNGATDIYLAKYDPNGGLVWGFGIGGGGVDQVYSVAVDPFGNAYLAGSFAQEVDFAPGDAVAAAVAGGERDGFVAKYGPTGELLWVTPLNPLGDDAVVAMSLDSAGNVVAAGLAGSVTLSPAEAGGRANVRRGDAFVFRLNSDGQLTWSSILPTRSEGVDPVAVAVGRSGEIYLAASYTGTIRVSMGNGFIEETSLGGTDLLLMRISGAGNLDWVKTMSGTENVTPGTGGLALDRAGNVLVTGTFDGLLNVGADGQHVLETKGQGDLFLASFAPDGTVRWATGIGGPELDGGLRVATDAAGYVYVAGWSSGDLPNTLAEGGQLVMGRRQPGGTDALLAKYTPDGRLAWAHGFGGTANGPGQSNLGTAVAVDPWGDVLLAGRFFGAETNFDPRGGAASLQSAGQSDGFVAKYGPDGSLIRR